MLEKLPEALGHALREVRPGLDRLVIHGDALGEGVRPLLVTSLAIDDGRPMPLRFTADGDGRSPPVQWNGVPDGAASVVVLIEDADSPTPQPLVHAIAWNLPGADGMLDEGALDAARDDAPELGRNSYLRHAYLPPDPPPGHGAHRYAIQVFALDHVPDDPGAGRGALVEALRGHVLACGLLIGTHEREDAERPPDGPASPIVA
ncbi:YbhB/YbcL family Raf kinase inhibitor-like protein [Coralloluteibacterium stylophorae]|uniref:YbhB/YbcL family Raf kinase inhibitor-like protein n=1 Tax=Coralloluteibacterium stylophorae TaxID=1776034 RepID=A0A8J8AXI2_9GAMM|nr:YbhB/YbcL family Raf kinase inhibitor-like protein [Coralloluteibacterium stylophorae]MBS7457963.1 YbhB/YbcL family Raf kinase inhibitor-like protein [Coralloluteibacterium stylophorae]